ncbi:MAG TPA: hypothetical protein VH916_05555 [Dehalococcoidia bacterium]|jgi:hypothetical protein
MIFISGMEDGSGSGEAASRKAGWLRGGALRGTAAQVLDVFDALNAALANRARGYTTPAPAPPAPRRTGTPASSAQKSAPRRPEFGPDGRPLPPDGSSPPRRSTATAKSRAAGAGAPGRTTTGAATGGSTPAPAPLGTNGRPVPPDGSRPPARPHQAAVGSAPGAGAAAPRVRGAPLPPGSAPTAPAGHTFVSRPVPAPPGEFLFEIRCSCGRGVHVPVKLADLRRAATGGASPAAAIAIATQDALDAMHAGR